MTFSDLGLNLNLNILFKYIDFFYNKILGLKYKKVMINIKIIRKKNTKIILVHDIFLFESRVK